MNIIGTDGIDTLVGGDDDDVIRGKGGNDTLDGGTGRDELDGGDGSDYYIIRDRFDHVSDSGALNEIDRGIIYSDFYKTNHDVERWSWAAGVQRLPYWLDALLPGDASGFPALLGSGKTFSYCFASTPPTYFPDSDKTGFQPFSAEQKAFAKQALDYISSVIDVKFVETANPNAQNTIVFANNSQDSSTAGYAYYPSSSFIGSDVLLNDGAENTAPSADGFSALVMIHELGHALGLKHPFYDGTGSEGPFLESGEDSAKWTVMSYDYTPASYALQYSPFDIAALQYLYGPSTASASDDVYVLNLNSANFIWDGAGRDTIDGSALTQNLTLYLEPGYWSYIGSRSSNIYAAGQVTVNFGTVIEDVKGGKADDFISANNADNRLYGNAGNDIIDAGAGNDVIDGGEGNDTVLGLSGTDIFLGGIGEDRMLLKQSQAEMQVIKLRGDACIVTDASGSNMAFCRNVERIYFSDGQASLAMTGITNNLDTALVQIYVAAFRRAPEKSGYDYWAQEVASRGIGSVADTIFSLESVKKLYPATMTMEQFVTTIYNNVFNRAPDPDGLSYWSQQAAKSSRGQMVIDMTTAALNAPDGSLGKDYFENRVDWSLYAVDYQRERSADLASEHLGALTDGIGSDIASLVTLIGQAESGATI